jgi:CRP-like cAMP-binding protein
VLHKDGKIELLRRVPLFAGCSKGDLVRIAGIASEIDFKPGKVLIKEGAPGSEFFILVDGSAEIRRKGRKIDSVGPGDFVGETALMSDHPRNATVTTTSPAIALVVTKRSFQTLVAENPPIALRLMQAMAERLPTNAST